MVYGGKSWPTGSVSAWAPEQPEKPCEERLRGLGTLASKAASAPRWRGVDASTQVPRLEGQGAWQVASWWSSFWRMRRRWELGEILKAMKPVLKSGNVEHVLEIWVEQ